MNKNDGGSAFPSGEAWVLTDLAGNKTRHSKASLVTGMSMRDYFAAFALQGLIVNPATVSVSAPITARAYELADAMLAERSK